MTGRTQSEFTEECDVFLVLPAYNERLNNHLLNRILKSDSILGNCSYVYLRLHAHARYI